MSNLLKNALLHNLDGGELHVLTTPDGLWVKNSGEASLDKDKLFHRFYHPVDGKKDSNGLGLAIAHTIAQSASLQLTYEWQDGMHAFHLVKENQ